MVKSVLYSEEIHCAGCAASITRSLGKAPGVESIHIDVELKNISVLYDPAKLTESALFDVLERAGFPAEVITVNPELM